MRFFASWWERVPTRRVGKALGVAALVAVLAFGFRAPTGYNAFWDSVRPAGDYWD